jgi:hypothetical protein
MFKEKFLQLRNHLDLRPIYLLIVLYTLVRWLPFGIFGWIQNEDGLMEWGSVALLCFSTFNAIRILRQSQLSPVERLIWIFYTIFFMLFIAEEISWGERLHGYGIESIQAINTQGETNLHNIGAFQLKGMLHLGWAALGLLLGLGSWMIKNSSLFPGKKLTLYFLIPAIWYVSFEFCREGGSCPITVENHQEIYEFLITIGLFLHTRLWRRRETLLNHSTSS